MQKLTPEVEERLRTGFKVLNKFMLLMWRLGLGWMLNIWPAGFGRIMVITHTGRKSGLRRRTPLNYAEVDGEIYCTAGFGHISDWYRNIMADPIGGGVAARPPGQVVDRRGRGHQRLAPAHGPAAGSADRQRIRRPRRGHRPGEGVRRSPRPRVTPTTACSTSAGGRPARVPAGLGIWRGCGR